ncbi:MAG: integrase arm-type DNA-binding domain-containing protein [Gallionellaceae bacterium]|jgi:integrase
MALTAIEISKARATDKPQKLPDGGGMYLYIHVNGGKYWRMDYRYGGKRKTLALGVYPEVSLADARDRREQARKLLANSADPCEVKKDVKKAELLEAANSFKMLSQEFHKMKSPMWTARHSEYWMLYMERYVFPVIGNKPIDKIDPMEIVGILRGLEAAKIFETRDRLGQAIGAVFKYAMATGRAKTNPADIRIALADRPQTNHYPCISTAETPDFLRAVSGYEQRGKVSAIAISAFRLLMLTATRTSEVRYSKWSDFNLDDGAWIVPAEQKGRKGKIGKRKDHAVPLSKQAVEILRGLHPITGECEFVFPNRNKTGEVISENTILKIIESIGYKGKMTGHGFRSLARSALGEMGYRWEVLEAMLSHAIPNQTAAAYIRTTYFEERRGVMQKWAEYLDKVEAGAEIIPLRT